MSKNNLKLYMFFYICVNFYAIAKAAPVEEPVEETIKENPEEGTDNEGEGEENGVNDVPEQDLRMAEERKNSDTPDKNATTVIKEWFDGLSKNASTNTQNAIKDLQQWFSGLSGNSESNNPFSSILGGASNGPMMILGSYQAVKLPLPKMGDIMGGLGNMASAANNINQLFAGLQGKN